MGLDMYLNRKVYVWRENRGSLTITGVKSKIRPDKVMYIVEEAGYWRKANAIHKWFVDNIQDGNDNCKAYYVSRENMELLLATVNKVLKASELVDGEINNGFTYENGVRKPIVEKGQYIKNPSVAQKLLPTTEGFFFGSTDYDQYYYQDLVSTKKILEEALQENDGDFEYESSW